MQSRRMTATRLTSTDPADLVARVAATVRTFLARDAEESVFLVILRGRVHGVLRRDSGGWRLGWLDDADPRLAGFGDIVPGDIDAPAALEDALRRHLGEGAAALRVTPVLAF